MILKRNKAQSPNGSLLRRSSLFIAGLLILSLIVTESPVIAESMSRALGNNNLVTTYSYVAAADAEVQQVHSNSNYGNSSDLDVVGSSHPIESYLKFSVSGASGVIQNALLRVYSTSQSTTNGPAVYGTSNTWTESGITWKTRPALTSGAIDNKGAIGTNTWVEYDVTSLVTGNGTYSFALVADSSDGIRFSSRQGSTPPQLVLTVAPNTPTSTKTLTKAPTSTNSSISSATATKQPTATQTAGPITTNTPVPTVALTQTLTTLTFIAGADATVSQTVPTTNYGANTYLQADGDAGAVVSSYIRFSVSNVTGSIQSVKLRVYCTTNATVNGPAAYLAGSNWIESGTGGITWNTQPGLLSGAFDNKNAIALSSWVEYDVTGLVSGNGTYTFALLADSNDGVTFSSREGAEPPQLVIQTSSGTLATPTSGPTSTNTTIATTTVTQVFTPTSTLTPPATATSTLVTVNSPTPTATFANSQTPTPSPTSSGSVVLVGAGDISSCSQDNDEATAKLLDGIPGTVVTLGDNAYDSGTNTEYLNCYDPTWGRVKARTNPVPGNHDYNTSGAAGYFQYFNNIPAYYAYNLGAWRIYALNSEIDVSATGAQVAWLQADLAANPKLCVLAYWHRPRWSSGSTHGSDSSMQTLWQILYNSGADVVLNGHEHNYERFTQMNASGSAISSGLREFVVGTGGESHYGFGTILSTSQVRDNSASGVLKLTLGSNGYDWQFIPVAGASFTDSGSGTCH
ncbi:MAG: DNRLRE domain-containing protein [Chloroflexota bacterium]